ATALATNPRAVVEPIHRPPRTPEGRTPHCHWTVRIDPDVEPAPLPEPAVETASSRIIDFRFAPPAPRDTTGQGKRDDYAGPLLADLVFSEFTSAALSGSSARCTCRCTWWPSVSTSLCAGAPTRGPRTGCSPISRPASPGSPRAGSATCSTRRG